MPDKIKKTRAVYPGSFDPITNGHLDIIQRAARVFDELIVAVVSNPSKSSMFTVAERIDMISQVTGDIEIAEIVEFEGLLVDFVKSKGANILVRGLRVVSDFDYEFQMALMNRKMAPEVETIFLMPKWSYTYLSSSVVREAVRLGGDPKDSVHPYVSRKLKEKFAEINNA
jgi:pantetheine-phosphate adenylyltransferase